MSRLLLSLLSALTLLTFLVERCAAWDWRSLGGLRIVFYLLFFIQILIVFYRWIRDPHFLVGAWAGTLLYSSVIAATLRFFLDNIPLFAFNTLFLILQICFSS